MTTATKLEEVGDGNWIITTTKTGSVFESEKKFSAKKVIVAAGTFNTQKLLNRMKDKGKLPKLLGQSWRPIPNQ